uniref:ATP-dependent DNA helicase n=1 Tax=Lactuca sativa TaxID=4236 RepID=A0A9R1WAJ3_LACSA|nr:hypothetical protein LSAT_V11C200059400 [Lactuca sativa]
MVHITHLFNSKKTRKLNSFYLDNTSNINLPTTSTHPSSTTTTVTTSTYKCIFTNYVTSTLSNKRQYSVLSDDMTSRNACTITGSSSSIKKSKNLSPIPLIDLKEDVENIHEVISENLVLGISKVYLDHGNQIFLWTNESIRGKQKGNKDFSLCCGYGNVQLPDLKNIGGKIDSSINRGNARYIFRLDGQNYHSIGSLLPAKGSQPKFSQLYIDDTKNENSNRQRCFSGEMRQSTSIDNYIIEDLKVMLDSNNFLVRSYRMLRIIGIKERDGRTYNLPTASEVAALIVGDICDLVENRDIIDDGYSVDILHRGVSSTSNSKRAKCTLREFFAFRIQDRDHSFSLILNSKRLHYIRRQPQVLKCESYENLRNQKAQGTINISNFRQCVIVPSSFTGSACYMLQNYLDAMSLCKSFGYPNFFLTFMYNPKWHEVKRFFKDTSLQPEDRPDILCRLFKIKLDAFIKGIKENHILGVVQEVVYLIEFQKRGFPHSHMYPFMHSDYKLPSVEFIDLIISAEIPYIDEDPELYSLVNEFMIHGQCGVENINYPCIVDKKCSKNFPKQFCNHTLVDQNGFPLYRRRNDGHFLEKSGFRLDNKNCSSIKYLFKYINMEPNKATVAIVRSNNDCDNNDAVDEINEYYDCINVSTCEESWQIFKYDVHCMYPSVVRLPFHIPDQQQIIYGKDDDIDNVLEKPSVVASKFTSRMEYNTINSEARELTYVEFPTKFFLKLNGRFWKRREVGKSIGKIHLVASNLGEAYFLRILINKVKGPTSFEKIRTVNGETYSSFRDVCYALRLLDDDKEYIDAIKEASHCGSVCLNQRLFGKIHENIWQMEFFITNEKGSSLQIVIASLLRKPSLIIWDEAPMVYKHAFEVLDRNLKDVLWCENSTISTISFGGKVIVFRGDFKQILHVVPGGSKHKIVSASLSSSDLWQQCKVHKLTKNMRLTVGRDQSDIEKKIRDFPNWLLDIGEGNLGGMNDDETIIDILDDILINDPHDPIGSLIEFVYPSTLEKYKTTKRSVLAPRNEVAQEINNHLLKKFPRDEVEYLSSESVPNHNLVSKIGVLVMLLRNIDQKNGLCYGTRMQMISLGKRVIETHIISRTNIGNLTFTPRMSLSPSKKNSLQIPKKTVSFGHMFCNDS